MTLPDMLTLSGWLTGCHTALDHFIKQANWHKEIKTKNSFERGAIVVSSCTGSYVTAPAALMFEKMNGETHKDSFYG